MLSAVTPAAAQQTEPPTVFEVASPILTVDQERLFSASAFGRRVQADIEARSAALAAENRTIEAELVAEEQELTAARPGLSPEEFRARADAFDARVQRIRTEQDAKARDLGTFRETERERFASEIGGVLADIARSRGALAVLDRRALLVSADSIDITDVAIAAIDIRLGEGKPD
jgi:Skp family chaperone for outer membrane proteins